MEMTQFAMVEELASLIKDNLFSKHLLLSTEEALVNFLEDDASPEGVLELKPMSPYHRLLLHRLADIYGFAHESVGEGEDRHLVLERCPESAIPPILVSDILWQYDDYQSPVAEQYVLRRSESRAMEATKELPSSAPIEEREASYLAARDRIFALNKTYEMETVAPRSRNVSAAARRMIAHALGQKLCSEASNQSLVTNDGKKDDHLSSTLENSYKKTVDHSMMLRSSAHDRKACNRVGGKSSSSTSNSKLTVDGSSTSLGSLEREQRGAAKRIFAHALGLPSKGNHRFNTKPNGGNKPCG